MALFVIVLSIADNVVKLPYFVFSPGSAIGVVEYIDIPDDKANPPDGDFFLTTVSLKQAHPTDIVWAKIASGRRIEKQKEVIGDYSPAEYLELNQEAMDESKQTAIQVAMTKAGYTVNQDGSGARIINVSEIGRAHV